MMPSIKSRHSRQVDLFAARANFLRICPAAKADSAANYAAAGRRMAVSLHQGAAPIEAAEIEYRFRWKALNDAGRRQRAELKPEKEF